MSMDIGNVSDKAVIPVTECAALLGEGPIWVAREGAVYWVDIELPRIWRFHAADGTLAHWTPPFRIGSLAPRTAGGFVAGSEHGFAFVDPEAGRYELIGKPETEPPGNRFNDGKVDRLGRFWAGTMDDAEEAATGALYRLDADCRWTRVDEGYRVANGPAFSPDGRCMYHTDSARRTIYRFALDERGQVSGREVFARFGEADGYPDGMTADADGFLWIAFWDGWCLRRLSPGGECVQTLKMPIQRPTSCTFGGPDLDRLFITSARTGLSEDKLLGQPLAGALFMAEPAVGGTPQPSFAG